MKQVLKWNGKRRYSTIHKGKRFFEVWVEFFDGWRWIKNPNFKDFIIAGQLINSNNSIFELLCGKIISSQINGYS